MFGNIVNLGGIWRGDMKKNSARILELSLFPLSLNDVTSPCLQTTTDENENNNETPRFRTIKASHFRNTHLRHLVIPQEMRVLEVEPIRNSKSQLIFCNREFHCFIRLNRSCMLSWIKFNQNIDFQGSHQSLPFGLYSRNVPIYNICCRQ